MDFDEIFRHKKRLNFCGDTDQRLDQGHFLKDLLIIALVSHSGGIWPWRAVLVI